jgi:hypothetical protein
MLSLQIGKVWFFATSMLPIVEVLLSHPAKMDDADHDSKEESLMII